jgi:segregation and condensation protein B
MDLVQIVEAIIFAAPEPVTTREVAHAIRKTAKAFLTEAEEAAALAAEAEGDADDTPPPKKKNRAKKKKAQEPGETDPEVLQKISAKRIHEIIDEINETYNATGRPMHLLEGPGGWRFYTRRDYAPYIRSLMPEVKPERFSGPAMETLAIIAYRQPITKADIEVVRGVSVDGVLNKIIDRGLVRIGGRADLPGRPLLYETSETFLVHFGIKSIDDLPNSGELRRVKLPSAEDGDGEIHKPEPDEQLTLGGNPEGGKKIAQEAAADGVAGETGENDSPSQKHLDEDPESGETGEYTGVVESEENLVGQGEEEE